MAEIKIEKKKPIWPWILLILIILAAIYAFWYYNDGNFNSDELLINDTITQADDSYRYDNEIQESRPLYTGTYGTVREEALADYFGYVDKLDNNSADQNYYRSAFFKLITATKRQSEIENVDVNNNISAAMESAEKLTNDSKTTVKANNVKSAANEVSKALKAIQQKEFDNLSDDSKSLETAVAGIDGTKTLNEQATNIDAFFDKAARILQKMYETKNNH